MVDRRENEVTSIPHSLISINFYISCFSWWLSWAPRFLEERALTHHVPDTAKGAIYVTVRHIRLALRSHCQFGFDNRRNVSFTQQFRGVTKVCMNKYPKSSKIDGSSSGGRQRLDLKPSDDTQLCKLPNTLIKNRKSRRLCVVKFPPDKTDTKRFVQ